MKRVEWNALDPVARESVLRRPESQRNAEMRKSVTRIIEQVRADGDSTLRALTRKFDSVELGDLRVPASEFVEAANSISEAARAAPRRRRR